MNVASLIDHTILTVDCTASGIEELCKEAMQYEFASVCVPPYYVKKASGILSKSKVKIATVIGFPMGYTYTPAKVEEVKRAMSDGAHELDVVVNIAAIKNKDWRYVENDIDSVTTASHLRGNIVKIIFEVDLLTEKEISKLCEICRKIGVDYVKTSTGFRGNGATTEIVESLRQQLPNNIKIKASGGIRTAEAAKQLILAGAKRLGTSKGVQIVKNTL